MKIRKKRTLTVDKFYSVEEIKELYYNKEIELVSYNEAIDFIKNYLTTEEICKNRYQWLYNGKYLCYLNYGRKLCTHQLVFYIKDKNNNLKIIIASKYTHKVNIGMYDDDIFKDYKFMVLT